MEYYKLLNLSREPFSNSPDPVFFFESQQHLACLQKLELSIRLRRGLNVVIGDVGTGKTTLCRQLIRRFGNDTDSEVHLILDPGFDTRLQFLKNIAEMLAGDQRACRQIIQSGRERLIKEFVKQVLFHKGVKLGKQIILIIDEGQKIPEYGIELLRELLNYETNDHKLLQIIIFAQREFERTIKQHDNFADRISFYYLLKPLDFKATQAMIRFRLARAAEKASPPALFTLPAIWAIYRATSGYPRQIVNVCHRSILTMIIQSRTRVSRKTAQLAVRGSFRRLPRERRLGPLSGLAAAVLVIAGLYCVQRFNILEWIM